MSDLLATDSTAVYSAHVRPQLCAVLSGERSAYEDLPVAAAAFPTAPELMKIVGELGFVNVRFKPLSLGLAALYVAAAV